MQRKLDMIPKSRRSLITKAALAILGVTVLCSSSAASASDAARILIKDFTFEPSGLTVTAGSTVTWVNMDDEPHTVVSDAGVFRSSAMDTSESFSFKFDKPGTYHFTCSIHPRMSGTIIVQ